MIVCTCSKQQVQRNLCPTARSKWCVVRRPRTAFTHGQVVHQRGEQATSHPPDKQHFSSSSGQFAGDGLPSEQLSWDPAEGRPGKKTGTGRGQDTGNTHTLLYYYYSYPLDDSAATQEGNELSWASRPRLKTLTSFELLPDLVSEPTGQVPALFQREQFAVTSGGGVHL